MLKPLYWGALTGPQLDSTCTWVWKEISDAHSLYVFCRVYHWNTRLCTTETPGFLWKTQLLHWAHCCSVLKVISYFICWREQVFAWRPFFINTFLASASLYLYLTSLQLCLSRSVEIARSCSIYSRLHLMYVGLLGTSRVDIVIGLWLAWIWEAT